MKHEFRKAIVAISIVMAVLTLTSAVGGTAYETEAIDPPAQPAVIKLWPDSTRDSAKALWTEQARSAAQPLAPYKEQAPETALAPPQAAPGRKEPVEERVNNGNDERSARRRTGAYTAFNGNEHPQMWQFHPYSAIGKLYFTTPAGPAYCTASLVGPDTILTAAQCVFNIATDNAYADFAFCPAARGASCPYGMFPWTGAFVPADFLQAENWQSALNIDVALLELEGNEVDERVHMYTDWLELAWDLPPDRHVFAIGYPITKSDEGFSQICIDQTYQAAVGIQKMGCDSGIGHLGGPWIVNFAPYATEGANIIHGVTSFQYTRGRNEIGGPRLSPDNIGALCAVVPGC